jgi:hypothetical protein
MNRVLITDDDPASRRLLEVRLRPLECDVATAGDGEQALIAIRKDPPDLVLLDLEMPRMGDQRPEHPLIDSRFRFGSKGKRLRIIVRCLYRLGAEESPRIIENSVIFACT